MHEFSSLQWLAKKAHTHTHAITLDLCPSVVRKKELMCVSAPMNKQTMVKGSERETEDVNVQCKKICRQQTVSRQME